MEDVGTAIRTLRKKKGADTDRSRKKNKCDFCFDLSVRKGRKKTKNRNLRKITSALENSADEFPNGQQNSGDVASNIRRAMTTKGVTQKELAYMINGSQPTVSRYLNGTSVPSATVIVKMASALGCTAEELLYGERESKEKNGR